MSYRGYTLISASLPTLEKLFKYVGTSVIIQQSIPHLAKSFADNQVYPSYGDPAQFPKILKNRTPFRDVLEISL